jgi:hypothetical protein
LSRYQLNKAMYEGVGPARVGDLTADKIGFLATYDLAEDERTALAEPDFGAILRLGGLPNLVFRYYRAHGLALDDFNDHLTRRQAQR